MKLRAIRRLNVIATSLVVVGVLAILGGLAVSLVLDSEQPFAVTHPTGWACVLASVLLSFAVDRVKCPQCGKPFNRPDYRNWFIRNLEGKRGRESFSKRLPSPFPVLAGRPTETSVCRP